MSWKEKFVEITSKKHSEQAIWFLNGFWHELKGQQAEDIWDFVHLMIEIETGQPKLYGNRKSDVKEGCDLDELQSHVFLEKMKETLTVLELRKRLKALDIDNNKKMALSEYLLDLYKKSPQALVNAPQGNADPVKLKAAQDLMDAASDALDAAVKAEKEAQAAQRVLDNEQKTFDYKLSKLKELSENGTGIKKMKAKNEMAQMLSEDPLPLRRARINQQVHTKRAEKALKAAKDKFQEAEDHLTAVKNAGDVAEGQIFWMTRELKEKKKFMPGGR